MVFVGVSESGTLVVDGETFALRPGRLVFVPKGYLRATWSGSGEFTYLTIHRRQDSVRLPPRGFQGATSKDAGSARGDRLT